MISAHSRESSMKGGKALDYPKRQRLIKTFTIGHCFVIIFKIGHFHTREKVGISHPLWKGELVPEFVESPSEVRAVKGDEERLVSSS